MGLLGALLLAGYLLGGVLSYAFLKDLVFALRWYLAARRSGSQFQSGWLLGTDRLQLERGGFPIELSNDRRRRTVAQLGLSWEMSRTFTLAPRKRGDEEGVRTGDGRFDELFLVRGEPWEVLARLDHELRGRLLRLGEWLTVEVRDRGLRVTHPLFIAGQALDVVISETCGLAQCFSAALSLDGVVVRATSSLEPVTVRLNALEVLLKHHAGTPEAIRAGALARGSIVHEERLLGVLLAEGPQAMEILATLHRDPKAPPSVRGRALRELVRRSSVEAFERELRDGAESSSPTLRAEVASILGEQRPDFGRAILLGLARDEEAAVLTQVARALRRVGRPGEDDVEEALLRVLAQGDEVGQQHAAAGLGALGSLQAVETLRRAARAAERTPELQRALRRAVMAIQTRHGGGAGQLSLTGGDGGLSLAAGEEGAVALVRRED